MEPLFRSPLFDPAAGRLYGYEAIIFGSLTAQNQLALGIRLNVDGLNACSYHNQHTKISFCSFSRISIGEMLMKRHGRS
jgi:hypothetical protein